MGSKYDSYWRLKRDEIQKLLEEASNSGSSQEIDVSDLTGVGERESWYGTVVVSEFGKKSRSGAHANSLGNVLIKSGVFRSFENQTFRLTVSRGLKLHAELVSPQIDKVTSKPEVREIEREPVEPIRTKMRARIRNRAIMWNDLRPEDIVGEDRTINKFEIVQDFLDTSNCKETLLTSPEALSSFLKNQIKRKFGVYCIYNANKREVLDVGKSKDLKGRIRKQLIGVKSRKDKTRPLRFPRLFFAFLKREYGGMKQKEYNQLPNDKKKEYVEFYQNKIFRSGKVLRVFFTEDHLRAIVLEHTLIKHFKSIGQCKYNFQV